METKKNIMQLLATIIFFSALLVESESSSIVDKKDISLQTVLVLLKVSNKISGECRDQLLTVQSALTKGEEWALNMMDATAKPQAGIFMGNIMHVGNYEECLEINEDFNGSRVQVKYCTVPFAPHPIYGQALNTFFDIPRIKFDDSMAFRVSYGVCVPKTCSAKDLQNIADILEDEAQFPLHFHLMDEFCDAGVGKPFSTADMVAIVIFSIFAAFVVCSTLYDIFVYQQLNETKKKPNLFVAFSVITNGKILFSTETVKDNLGCLNGLRVLSLMWIVLGHVFFVSLIFPSVNTLDIMKWQNEIEFSLIEVAILGVDTFFTISGLLVVYLFMKYQSRGIKFSIPMFYIHRILRLSPSLAMAVLFSATLITHMGDGPSWPTVEHEYQKPCQENWWTTLIYLQNYIHRENQCLQQCWYLSVDTQMYFLSPIVLFGLVKWPKQTIGAVAVVIALSCSYMFERTWKKHLGATSKDENLEDVRFPTHVRCVTYLIGMICGYYVHKTRTSRPVKLSKLKVLILWLFSLSMMTGIVLSHSVMMRATEYDVLSASFYNSLAKIGWSIVLSLTILLCVNGYGGPINAFLSNKIFTVLIRLNYSVYILHIVITAVVLGQRRTPSHLSYMFVIHDFWGFYIYTLGAAIIWTLAFELPIVTIEKIVFGKKKQSDSGTTNGNLQTVKIVGESISEHSASAN